MKALLVLGLGLFFCIVASPSHPPLVNIRLQIAAADVRTEARANARVQKIEQHLAEIIATSSSPVTLSAPKITARAAPRQMPPRTPSPSPSPTPTPSPAPTPTPPQPAPSPAPTPAPTPPVTGTAAQIEQYVFQFANDERTKKGLSPLSNDSALASIARAHSTDMLSKNYFNHNSLSGCDPKCRLDGAEYPWTMYGENIYTLSGYNLPPADIARMIVDGWMGSAGHRANILKPDFTHAGTGVAVSGTKVYITTDYALPG